MSLTHVLILACGLVASRGEELTVMIQQNMKVKVHEVDTPKAAEKSGEPNDLVRSLLANVQLPGMPSIGGAEMPNIDMGEAMKLLVLLPELIEGIEKQLPAVVEGADTMAKTTQDNAKELIGSTTNTTKMNQLVPRIIFSQKQTAKAWKTFVNMLMEKLTVAVKPTLKKAADMVSFIPKDATEKLVQMLTGMLGGSGIAKLAEVVPNATCTKEEFISFNREAEKHWNETNASMAKFSGMIGGDVSVLDMLKSLPLGVNVTEVVERVKPKIISILDDIDAANNNIISAIHKPTELIGIDWKHDKEEVSESGSFRIKTGLALLMAAVVALFF